MEVLNMMGERLKGLREERRFTRKQMAQMLECTPSHYQKIEYGKVNISATTLHQLAEQFQVSADYLLGRTDRREMDRVSEEPQ